MTGNAYIIRKALPADIPAVAALADSARQIMRSSGNPSQWSGGYPSITLIEDDIRSEDCYLVMDGCTPVGSFVFRQGPDPSYASIRDGHWAEDSSPYMVIHRITSLPEAHGVFASSMEFCKSRCGNIRIDTHEDNLIMRHLVIKHGFRHCGTITLAGGGGERLAYQWLRPAHPDE